MIQIDWSECLLKEDVVVAMSSHALDRAAERGNAPIMAVRQEVEHLIHAAEGQLMQYADKFRTFILKGKDRLAVVGALIKRGKDYIFKVITLHKKKNFVANNPDDKVISVEENVLIDENNSSLEIGDKVRIKKEYGGGTGTVVDIVNNFIIVKTKDGNQSFHMSDLMVEDLIPGGKGDDADLSQFTIDQIIKGLQVEKEHTNNVKIALEIVADHLTEDGFYYDNYDFPELKQEKKHPLADILNNGGTEEDLSANSNRLGINRALDIMSLNDEPQEDHIFLRESENPVLNHLKQVFKESVNNDNVIDLFIAQQFGKEDKGLKVLGYKVVDKTIDSKEENAQEEVRAEGQATVTDNYAHEFQVQHGDHTHEITVFVIETREVHKKSVEEDGYMNTDVYQDMEWEAVFVDGGEETVSEESSKILDKTFNWNNKLIK